MNIYQKMQKISSEVGTVAKSLSVGYGKNSYKAVSEGDILSAVKPIEEKYGIYSYPVSRTVIDSGEMVSTTESNGKTYEKRQLWLRIETVYRFINTENPEEYIDITTYGDGVDSQDKSVGKAMTYADKYALMKAYKIQTGDDPDQKASEPLKGLRQATISDNDAAYLASLLGNDNNINLILGKFKKDKLEDLTRSEYVEAIRLYEARKK